MIKPSLNEMKQRGNALFYVLLGVVLLGALSFIVSRQMGDDGIAAQMDEDKAGIIAGQMISHSTTMKFAIQQMLNSGSTIDDIDFVKPDEAGYDTPPHQHKVYHPGGGGVTLMIEKDEYWNASGSTRGWEQQEGYNVEWTPTTQTDIIYSFADMKETICKKINMKLTGSETIPSFVSPSNISRTLVAGGTDGDFTAVGCPVCEGVPALCLSNPSGSSWAFYNIVAAR